MSKGSLFPSEEKKFYIWSQTSTKFRKITVNFMMTPDPYGEMHKWSGKKMKISEWNRWQIVRGTRENPSEYVWKAISQFTASTKILNSNSQVLRSCVSQIKIVCVTATKNGIEDQQRTFWTEEWDLDR